MARESRVDWPTLKAFVDDRKLSIQWVDRGTEYWLKALDGIFFLECDLDKNPSDTTDLNDFETNYKAVGNRTPKSETLVKEEDVKTGGHFQNCSFLLDIGSGDSVKSLDISFPVPISILSASWQNKAAFDGDSIEFTIAPNTVIGTIGANVAVNDTEITVSQTVLDNVKVGYWVDLYDGTNTENLGRVLSIDTANSKITVETASTQAFLAATPTYVRQTIKMLPKSKLDTVGPMLAGDSKIGGSYIPANTILKAIYYNDAATAKKMVFFLEYLY